MLANGKKQNALLVEDHVSSMSSIAWRIARTPSLALVATARSPAQISASFKSKSVDLCFIDVGVRSAAMLNTIHQLESLSPRVRSVVVSNFDDERSVYTAIEAGASGYLLKSEFNESIDAQIHALLTAGAVCSPSLIGHLLKRIRTTKQASRSSLARSNGHLVQSLSARELEVLNLMAMGHSYSQASAILAIEPNTVSVHLRNIYRKLEAHSRSEAIYKAGQLGLIKRA